MRALLLRCFVAAVAWGSSESEEETTCAADDETCTRTAETETCSDGIVIEDVATWQRDVPDGDPRGYPEYEYLRGHGGDEKSRSALVFPGGGSDAFSVSVGAVRALRVLGLEDAAMYWAMVSGGNYVSGYLYSKETDEEALVGAYLTPGECTLEALRTEGGLLSRAPSTLEQSAAEAYGACSKEKAWLGENTADCWIDALHARYAAPFGIPRDAPFAFDEAQVARLKETYQEALKDVDFVTVRRRGDKLPPFPLSVGATVGVYATPQQSDSYLFRTPTFTMSPIMTGFYPKVRSFDWHFEDGTSRSVDTGGFVETFAFLAEKTKAEEKRSSVPLCVKKKNNRAQFFSLAQAMGISSLVEAVFGAQASYGQFSCDEATSRNCTWEKRVYDQLNFNIPVNAFLPPHFGQTRFSLGDGGNSPDVWGIGAVLRRGVDKILVVDCQYMTKLNARYEPSFDPTTGTTTPAPSKHDVDEYFSKYFGFRVGYPLYSAHFFEQEGYARLVSQITANARAGRPAFGRATVTTVRNALYGVPAGKQVDLGVLINSFDATAIVPLAQYQTFDCVLGDTKLFKNDWFNQLPEETRKAVYEANKDGSTADDEFHGFPIQSPIKRLSPAEVDLNANMISWGLLQNADSVRELLT